MCDPGLLHPSGRAVVTGCHIPLRSGGIGFSASRGLFGSSRLLNGIALDPAASEFQEGRKYVFRKSGEGTKTSDQMIAMYEKWVKTYPILSIEDGLGEKDWKGWADLTKALGSKILCGPYYQPLGSFTGAPPTETEHQRAADAHREAADEHAVKEVDALCRALIRHWRGSLPATAEGGVDHVVKAPRPHEPAGGPGHQSGLAHPLVAAHDGDGAPEALTLGAATPITNADGDPIGTQIGRASCRERV